VEGRAWGHGVALRGFDRGLRVRPCPREGWGVTWARSNVRLFHRSLGSVLENGGNSSWFGTRGGRVCPERTIYEIGVGLQGGFYAQGFVVSTNA